MSPHRSGATRTSSSPQPRIFGSSTFYLPQSSDNPLPSTKSGQVKKSCMSESSTSSSTSQTKQSTSCVTKSKSLSSNLSAKSSLSTTKASNNGGGSKMTTAGSNSKLPQSGLGSSNISNSGATKNTLSARSEGPHSSARHNSKSPSPASSSSRSPSLECSSPTQNSESSSSIETAYMNKSSSSSSRETSVESDSSIVHKTVSLSTSTNAAGTPACSGGDFNSSSTPIQAFRTKGSSKASLSVSGKNSPNFDRSGSSPNCDPCDGEDTLCCDSPAASAGERRSPEKRKNRSGSEDSKGKEKRRSCDLELGLSDDQLKKPISLKSGVRLAQELLQSMENIVSTELSEIRRCTAELSSRYRLKPRQRDPEATVGGATSIPYGGGRKIKAPMSQFYLLPDRPTTPSSASTPSAGGGPGVSGGNPSSSAAIAAADCVTSSRPHHRLHHHHHRHHHHHHHHHHQKYPTSSKDTWSTASFASSKEIALSGAISSSSGTGGDDGGERSRSEPPFSGDEGLYRAQSCPGLPLPQQQLQHLHPQHHQQQPTHLLYQERSDEGRETVAELRRPGEGGVLLRLRTDRTPPAREKLLNRYSCGTLDTQKQLPTPPRLDAAFESCPDLATLRGGRVCTSDSSSSSVSSSRSSFSRLLPVS